ncbi:MAG: hypothetical protein ACJ741_08450 [Pyrinomonadaceae bacterium]
MSDYLWDKTGEVDAEAERLEELLGTLRFQPRTFEVPATLPVTPRRAPRAVSQFSWTRLAVAASLALVALAGAWLVMTKQRTHDAPNEIAKQAPSNDVVTPQPPQPQQQQLAGSTSPTNDSTTATNDREKHQAVLIAAPRAANRHPYREQIAGGVKRPAPLPRHSIERDENAPLGDIATTVTPQEREAMEKFMLAMKVTSEKLNYAERQVAELNTKSPQR